MRVLVIGKGVWGTKLYNTVCTLGYEVVAATRDWEDHLTNVTHAIIATPASSHAAIAESLLRRGIHCLVEKPAVLTTEQALRLKEASNLGNSKVFCHTPYLYHNLNMKLIEKVTATPGTFSYRSIRKNVEGKHADGNSFINLAAHDLANLWALGARNLELSYASVCKNDITVSLHNITSEEICRRAYITTGKLADRKTRYIYIEKDKAKSYQLVDDKFLIRCSELDETLLPSTNAIEYSLKDFIAFTHAPCDIEFIEWSAKLIETVSTHLGSI